MNYHLLNWADQALASNCFMNAQDIIIMPYDGEVPLYGLHAMKSIQSGKHRDDVHQMKLKKKLFPYKKPQRKKNLNVHKNLLNLVDLIETQPPILPLPRKIPYTNSSNESANQIELKEQIISEPISLSTQQGTLDIKAVVEFMDWPSLWEEYPPSLYDQDMAALLDLHNMTLILLRQILQHPDTHTPSHDFCAKTIERIGFDFGPNALLVLSQAKSHYHDMGHPLEYTVEDNTVTRKQARSHKKTVSNSSLMRLIKRDKKSNEYSISTLQRNKKKKEKVIVPNKTIEVYCEEKVVNKVTDTIQYLVRSCYMPMDVSVKKPSSIVMSCLAGLLSVVQVYLQQKQFKIDHSWYDMTPLMAACCSRSHKAPEIVQLLLQHHADQTRGIRLGLYALLANLGGHLTFSQPQYNALTIQKETPETHITVDYTKFDSSHSFKDQVQVENEPMSIRRLPRVLHAQCSRPHVIKTMNIHEKVLPLDVALAQANWTIVMMLLKQSTSTVKDSRFCLLCHLHVNMQMVLIRYHAHVDMRDEYGFSFLHLAARHGHLDMLLLGLQYIDKNDQNNVDMYTPLHEAAYHGHGACVRALLWMGADPHLKNAQGETVMALCDRRFYEKDMAWVEVQMCGKEVVMQRHVYTLFDPKQDQQFIERKKSLEEMQERIKREDCLTNLFWLKE